MMNNKPPNMNSENDKHREIIKQQLRAMTNSRSAPSGSKVLSADSMIEDLLSKKETFQRKDNKIFQNVATWLIPGSGNVHPLYERVWTGVQSNIPHLADTPRLSTLLMTSGLPTDGLGFIWSLANHTVVGALTQQELYIVLALVALAQSGYAITTTAVLNQLPQPPLPKLDFTIISLPSVSSITTPSLSSVPPNVSFSQQVNNSTTNIAPLSASSLLDAKPRNNLIIPPSVSPATNLNTTDNNSAGIIPQGQKEIGISYVSNHILPGQTSQSQVNFMGIHPNIYSGTDNLNFNESQRGTFNHLSSTVSSFAPSHQHLTESSPSYKISSDTLTSKLSTLSVQNNDSKINEDTFDDEFTDFQTADFKTQKVQNSVNLDNDEFSNFQSVSVNSDSFVDKSEVKEVCEIEQNFTKPATSASKLSNSQDTSSKGVSFINLVKPSFYSDKIIETSKWKTENKPVLTYTKKEIATTFHETISDSESEDKYNIFHNPLPELLEDKYSVFASLSNEESQGNMNFSNFNIDKDKEDLQESQNSILELPKIKSFDNVSVDLDDDEYSDFHSFDLKTPSKTETKELHLNHFNNPILTPNSIEKSVTNIFENEFNMFNSSDKPIENDKNVSDGKLPDIQFNTFQQNVNSESFKPIITESVSKLEQFADFQNDLFLKSANSLNPKSEGTSESFSDFMSAEFQGTTDSLPLPQSTFNEQIEEKHENTVRVESTEDKYSALRILEPVAEDTADDFGDFLEANTTNLFTDKPLDETIQLRCLDACLMLLQSGESHLSTASTPEVLAEVMSDPRVLDYLECLQEVNKVSDRILTHIDAAIVEKQRIDLVAVREKLTPYFSRSQQSTMEETKGTVCGLCRSDTGPCPIKYGLCTFHAPCANLYLHCIDSVLPNITSVK